MLKTKKINFYKILKNRNSKNNILLNININFLIFKNNRITNNKKLVLLKKKHFLKNNSKNICSLTGSTRAIFNNFLLSRHTIRDFGENSNLPNFTKLSW